MAAYLVVRVDITDPEKYKEYLRAVPKIIEKHGGKYVVRGGEVTTLEGPEENRRMIIVEFPSVQRVAEFYNSVEYTEARKLREGAAIGQMIAVEGVDER